MLLSQGWTACVHLAALLSCWTAEALIPLCAVAEPTMRQEKNPNQGVWHFFWSVEAVFAGKFMLRREENVAFLFSLGPFLMFPEKS